MTLQFYPNLYTVDGTGRRRVWYMEQDGGRYRAVSGLVGGVLVSSGWTVAKPKNVGRLNETTAEDQARLEIEAEYRKKRDRKYYDRAEDAAGAKFFAPMLAHTYAGKLPRGVFYSQPKLDGVRCIATRTGLWSRQGKPFLSTPHIHDALKPLFERNPDLIFDGELYNHKLHDDFNAIISLVKKQKPSADELARSAEIIQYHIYDLPSESGGFARRFGALCALTSETHPLDLVPTRSHVDHEQLDAAYVEYIEMGYEGQMIRSNGPYENRRSKSLLKRKEFQDAEFPVVAIEEGVGNWAGCAKRAIIRLPDGRTAGSGIKGSQEFTQRLLRGPMPRTATVRYFNLTPDGVPRFPVAVAFHDGDRDV